MGINRLSFTPDPSTRTQPGFVAVPWALLTVGLQEPTPNLAIYQAALEQARAVVRPSLPERDLLAVWN